MYKNICFKFFPNTHFKHFLKCPINTGAYIILLIFFNVIYLFIYDWQFSSFKNHTF